LKKKFCMKKAVALELHTAIGEKHKLWAKERAAGAVCSPSVCVSVGEQKKRYNLIRGHHCGLVVRTAVGTSVVYSAYIVGLYTGTVHVC
jgi:hypothetical protein